MDLQLQKLLCNTSKHSIQRCRYIIQLNYICCILQEGLLLPYYNIIFFTFAGFIQPTFVDRMLQADDPDGFVDRQLFDFPPEMDVYLDDLKVPIPQDVPKMMDVFKVLYLHRAHLYTRLSCRS